MGVGLTGKRPKTTGKGNILRGIQKRKMKRDARGLLHAHSLYPRQFRRIFQVFYGKQLSVNGPRFS